MRYAAPGAFLAREGSLFEKSTNAYRVFRTWYL
jgi:hypothetical protein